MNNQQNLPTSLNGDHGYVIGQLMLAFEDGRPKDFRRLLNAAAAELPLGVVDLVVAMSDSLLEFMKAQFGNDWRNALQQALDVMELEHSIAAPSAEGEGR